MKRYFLIFFFLAMSLSSFAKTLRLQCVADMAIRQHKASFSNDFVETNLGKAPVLSFHGIHYIGGPREVASILVLNFDLTPIKSKLVEKATLYLRGKNDVSKMKLVSVSTVSSPWVEGSGLGKGPGENGAGATAHWASYKKQRWIENDPQSELIDVSFGLGNSFWKFEQVCHLDNNWIAIDIPQQIIAALNAGASYGIALMEEKGQTEINYQIYSRESTGNEPYLIVEDSERSNTTQLKPPKRLVAKPAPDLATLQTGAIRVQFDAPAGEAVAYCVTIKTDDETLPLERYLIPFPKPAGTRQQIELAGIKPEQMVQFSIVSVDGAGSESASVKVSAKASSAFPVPALLPIANRDVNRDGPFTVGKNIRIWAYDGDTKAHPVSGNLLEEVGYSAYAGQSAGNYRQGNDVWTGKTVEIAGCRNEYVTFHLCIEALKGLSNGKLLLGDFDSPKKEKLDLQFSQIYRDWYVKDGEWMPEIALPLSHSFSIPARDNNISGQKNQSFLVELYIPHKTASGLYKGNIFLKADGIDGIKIPVKLTVWNFSLPDSFSFNVELNAYNWQANDRDYFRLARVHRATLNVLPYLQEGNVKPGAAPEIKGAGANTRIIDWTAYDKRYSALFDGSAFQDLPGGSTPLKVQYLPLHENWPALFHENIQFKSSRKEYRQWLVDIALNAPSIEKAFSQNYEDTFIAVTRQFVEHFDKKGWNDTKMQFYLNNKRSFTKGKLGWWNLDEPQNTDDVLALRYFGLLFKKGVGKSHSSQFVFRCDISRPQFTRHLLDNICDQMYVSIVFFNKNNLCQQMMRRGIQFFQYGSANRINMSNLTAVLWPMRSYLYGAEGVLPWNSFEPGDCFHQPRSTALLISGKPIGLDTVVASLRLKAMRRGEQDIEYLELLGKKKGYNRLQIRHLILSALRFQSKVVTKDSGEFEDAGMISFENVDARRLSDMRRAIAKVLTE